MKHYAHFIISCLVVLASCATKKDIEALSTRIDGIENDKIATISNQVNSINNSLTSLKNTDTQLQGYIATLQEQEKALKLADDNIQKSIVNLKTEIYKSISEEKASILNNLEGKTAELVATINELNSKITALEAKDKALEQKDSDIQEQIDKLNSDLLSIQSKYSELSTEISTLEAELNSKIPPSEANCLAQLEAYKSVVAEELKSIKTSIATLQSKDEDLQAQINNLETYVENKLTGAKDWASATFATLEQYNITAGIVATIQGQIECINSTISELQKAKVAISKEDMDAAINGLAEDLKPQFQKIINDTETALQSITSEITSAYTTAIQTAISTSEISIKSWVNEQFSQYYSASQTDAKLSALQVSLEGQLNSQKEYLEGLINNLKSELITKIGENETLLDELRRDLTKAQEAIGKNSELIAGNAANIKENAKSILANSSSIKENAEAISENAKNISENANGIRANATEISAIKSQMVELEKDLNSELGSLQSRINTLEIDFELVSSSIGESGSDVSAIHSVLSSITSDIEAIRKEMEFVKSEYSTKITSLQTELNTKIEENTDLIDANKSIIEANSALISQNKTAIEANTTLINQNKSAINELRTSSEAALAKNAEDIATNAANIASNTSLIETNANNIASNASLIAANTAAISNNEQAIAQNTADITQMKAQMATDKAEITAAYIKAIEEAINTSEGKLAGQIATEVSALNARIDAEIETVNTLITSLTKRVEKCENDIAELKKLFNSFNNSIKDFNDKFVDLISIIQSVKYVPEYSDGKTIVTCFTHSGSTSYIPGEAKFIFEITPASATEELNKIWQKAVSMKAVYTTNTKSAPETTDLKIKTFTAENGFLNICVDCATLKEDFYKGVLGASARLRISYGATDIISDYIPLRPIATNNIDIKDSSFRTYCLDNFDMNKDGMLSENEVEAVATISCSQLGITSIDEISYFKNLEQLDLSGNQITSINVSNNHKLNLLDISNNDKLVSVSVNGCPLTTLKVSGNLSCLVGQYVEPKGEKGVIFTADKTVQIVSARQSECNYNSASSWCRSLGSGWYLPSSETLLKIYNIKHTLNSTLTKISGAPLEQIYWCSDPYYMSGNYSYGVDLRSGYGYKAAYDSAYWKYVRAVRSL